jgi:hypothetical protein
MDTTRKPQLYNMDDHRQSIPTQQAKYNQTQPSAIKAILHNTTT